MQKFTVSLTSNDSDGTTHWQVRINGSLHRRYASEWAAMIDAFIAAHDATQRGEEATVVIETSSSQQWTFSLLPTRATRDSECDTGSAANDADERSNDPTAPAMIRRAG